MSVEGATAFLDGVQALSRAWLQRHDLPPQSPNGGLGSHATPPRLVVLHYSTSSSLLGTTRWLCDPSSKVSAHFVVGTGRESPAGSATPPADRCAPLAERLAAPILQLRPLDATAWHATWVNGFSIGIELCNDGEVRFDDQGRPHVCRGSRGWQPDLAPQGRLLRAGERSFSGYTEPQMQSLHLLLHALFARFRLPSWALVGHEHVQGVETPGAGGHDKRDLSAAFGLQFFRAGLQVGGPDVELQDVLQRLAVQGESAAAKKAGIRFIDLQSINAEARRARWSRTRGLFDSEKDPIGAALDLLDYDGRPNEPEARKEHVRLFQMMMGLSADGVPGRKTRDALLRRLDDRLGKAASVQTGQGAS